VNYLSGTAIEDGEGFRADLVIEEEERGGDRLSEEDMGLELPWMGSSNPVARSWEEIGVDELSDFER
jgi:hypothetical protein